LKKKTVVITRSGSCARLSIHTTNPTGASITAEKRVGKTTSNFLILKAVYVLFSRNRTVASSNPAWIQKGWRDGYFVGEGEKKRN